MKRQLVGTREKSLDKKKPGVTIRERLVLGRSEKEVVKDTKSHFSLFSRVVVLFFGTARDRMGPTVSD